MLSQADIERIKAAIATFERARESCTGSGALKVIDAWITEANKKLAEK